jgi:hypothetical protein
MIDDCRILEFRTKRLEKKTFNFLTFNFQLKNSAILLRAMAR